MDWEILGQKTVLRTIPFTVEEVTFKDKTHGVTHHPYHRLLCTDWVNVLPITANKEAILISQTRAGVLSEVLEVPGGAVDANEKDTTMAAMRELEEETGFISRKVIPLGSINPNPALNNNRLHMFLAFNCEVPSERKNFPDPGENIKIHSYPISDLDEMVRHGRINSCLSALTIMLAQKYLR